MLAVMVQNGVLMVKVSVVRMPLISNVTMYDPAQRFVRVVTADGRTAGNVAISCQMIDKVSTFVVSNVAVPLQMNGFVGIVVTEFCENEWNDKTQSTDRYITFKFFMFFYIYLIKHYFKNVNIFLRRWSNFYHFNYITGQNSLKS